MDCVRKLLAARPHLYPQFATHNALTVASVIEQAGGVEGYEFQRLHGMGEALYEALLADEPAAACRVYAPVGGHRDLLAYLVRRLLENGANSSFVSVAADPSVPVATILKRPQDWIADAGHARHPRIPLPRDLYGAERKNSAGVEFGDRASLEALVNGVRNAAPLRQSKGENVADALAGAAKGFAAWNATPVDDRAAALERIADLYEQSRDALIALLQTEGGKTLDDALAEVREAVDFCRYYAARGAAFACSGTHARADRRDQRSYPSRARRVRLHQPVEFPARDLHRPDRGGAGRGQLRDRQARRADAADRRRGGPTDARCGRAEIRAASRHRRRQGRCGSGRGRARRGRCLHGLDRSRMADQPRTRGERRTRSCR